MYYKNHATIILLILAFSFCYGNMYAQHRGENISIQGFDYQNVLSARALGMGGAITANDADLSSVYWNPAGLSGLKGIQISVDGNYSFGYLRENQEYRPNRYFVTLPFYLEGLYTPDPKNDGLFDNVVAKDSNYFVNPPLMGLDKYSKEAADWQKDNNEFIFNNVAVAMPFQLGNHNFVAALAFYNKYVIHDFDRNDTYLSPDIGSTLYNDVLRVNGHDTAAVDWYRYYRQKNGNIYNASASLAYEVTEFLSIGATGNYIWGKTNDIMSLSEVGSIHLIDQNRFKFWHIYQDYATEGKSDYKGYSFNLGVVVKLKNFNLGIKVDLPYTFERTWNYVSTSDNDSVSTSKSFSGTDKYKFPLCYSLGVSFTPVDNFTFAFDYQYSPFSKTEYELGSVDTTFRPLVDQKTIRAGISYAAAKYLTLRVGYRYMPATFIPDGSNIPNQGPAADSYTFGASINLWYGSLDIAYEIRRLKYYDSYYSNTNYNLLTQNNLLVGYTIAF